MKSGHLSRLLERDLMSWMRSFCPERSCASLPATSKEDINMNLCSARVNGGFDNLVFHVLFAGYHYIEIKQPVPPMFHLDILY